MVKAAFNKKKFLFCRKFDLNLRKEIGKRYTWERALHDSETLTLRKIDKK
jgi:hypothetical protein